MLNKLNVARVLALAVASATLLTVVGCNTVEGVGEDTQKAGEKIENAAERNK